MTEDTSFWKRQTDKFPARWKVATLRCLIYGGIVGWGVFKAGTNGFDSLSDMTPLQHTDLTGDVLVSMGGVWLAFLDQTLSKLGNQNPPANPPASTVNNP